MRINPLQDGTGFAASVHDCNLNQPIGPQTRQELVNALLKYRVLAFPDQDLDDDALERVSLSFGPFGDDPFIAPIAGREHIIAVQRRADETAPVFAENWHTDWSFQIEPPAATALYGLTIPPRGGDTCFADQHRAAVGLPAALRKAITGKNAVHSAVFPYAPEGVYGDADRATDRSMDIRADESARATQLHPLLSAHPETGLERVYGCVGYVIGIDGVPDDEAIGILMELMEHQTQPEYVYEHPWQENMLVIWDNRAVLHRATGGYDGFDRLLHRTTIQSLSHWTPSSARDEG